MKYAALLCGALIATAALGQSKTPFTLERALALALHQSPALRAADLNTQAAEKAVDAAGLRSNPELYVEAEGLGGDRDLYRDAEYVVGIQQSIQRGGKRLAERNAALQAIDITAHAGEEKKRELAAAVRRAFAELQAQQEIERVRSEQVELSRAIIETAEKRFEATVASELEVVQAELAYDETVFAQRRSLSDLAAARAQLASLIGVPAQELPEAEGPYYQTQTFEQIRIDDTHPTLRRLDAEEQQILAEAQWAKTQDVSDITLGAGFKHEAESNVNSFVFSASMPLNLSKRGQAEHAVGLLRAEAVRAARAEAYRQLLLELNRMIEQHKSAISEATATQEQLLPKAEKAYILSREGYNAGRYSWLELIEAQQHLAEVRIRQIETLLEVHLLEADLSTFRENIK